MVTIDEHTFDETKLNPNSRVLDVGCRGFGFSQWLVYNVGCNVVAIDADPKILNPNLDRITFLNKIVAHSDQKSMRLFTFGNGTANYIESVFEKPSECEEHEVEIFNIEPYWDLIKLDCEGAEYDILMNMKTPLAEQISVEFHEHTGAAKGDAYMKLLFEKMDKWYKIEGVVKEAKHGCGPNYWDVLFIRRAA